VSAQFAADQALHFGMVLRPEFSRVEVLLDDGRADVTGHDDDGIPEINGPPLPVRQPAIVKDLEQNIEDVVMRFSISSNKTTL